MIETGLLLTRSTGPAAPPLAASRMARGQARRPILLRLLRHRARLVAHCSAPRRHDQRLDLRPGLFLMGSGSGSCPRVGQSRAVGVAGDQGDLRRPRAFPTGLLARRGHRGLPVPVRAISAGGQYLTAARHRQGSPARLVRGLAHAPKQAPRRPKPAEHALRRDSGGASSLRGDGTFGRSARE